MATRENKGKSRSKGRKTLPGANKQPESGVDAAIGRVPEILKDRRFIGAFVLFVLVCVAIGSRLIGGLMYHEGEIAAADIISPVTVQYQDTGATEEARKNAARELGDVYRLQTGFRSYIEEVFKTILEAGADADKREAAADELAGMGLSTETVDSLLSMKKDEPVRLRLKVNTVLHRIAPEETLDEQSIRRLDEKAVEISREVGIPAGQLEAVAEVISRAVNLYTTKDPEATLELAEEKESGVGPVMRTIRRGEVIVRRGDAITGAHLDAMVAAGLSGGRASWAKIIGFLLLEVFVFGVIGVYMKRAAPEVFRNENKMFIFYITILLTVVSCVVISSVDLFSGYLLGAPLAALTILMCVLLKPEPALAVAPAVALAVAPTLGFEMPHFVVAVTAALAAYYFSAGARDRDALLKAGLAVSLSSMAVILVLSLIGNVEWKDAVLDILLFGVLNGLIASVAAMGSLPVFERLFNITTSHRLLELSNPEEPLLKRMLIHAPGTYYHSFFVGNLAETAADAVGADALLVRIACYYHDVGKLKRPYFFTENHMDQEKPLDGLPPTMGALVIRSHVKDGVEMAHEHKLPKDIVDIIAQHHGTMLISFFHKQAVADAPEGKEVSEDQFRYPGPKPRTAEAAVVMIADSCEAAVRSIKEPTPKLIENTVNKLIKERVVDGQFEECNITLKQIDTLRLTMIKTLAGVYHSRMKYPELDELKAQKELKKNGNGGNKEPDKG